MAKQSVGILHGIISGDASPMINELKRADEATRARAASIGGQMDKLGRDLAREFSAAKIGKNLLSGIGIGSGAALVMTGVDYFVGMWKEAAEYAKVVDERAKDIAKSMLELRQIRFDKKVAGAEPEERMTLLNSAMASKAAERDKAEEDRLKALRGYEWASSYDKKHSGVMIRDFEGEDFAGGKDNPGMRVSKFTDLMLERADAAQLKSTELSKELEKLAAQATTVTDELAAAGKKLKAEMDKHEASQLELLAKERQLIGGKPLSQLRYEGGDEDYARGMEELQKYRDELRTAGEKHMDRVDRESGRMRVDDMTKRGLGTGANYGEWQKTAAQLLKEIRDLIERAISTRPATTVYAE